MPWIIKSGWRIGKDQVDAPTKIFSGHRYYVVSPDGRMMPTGYGDDGKNLAEMVVQGMEEAAGLRGSDDK